MKGKAEREGEARERERELICVCVYDVYVCGQCTNNPFKSANYVPCWATNKVKVR